jgi:hypothetical protein
VLEIQDMAGKPGMHKRSYMREDALERIRDRIKNSQLADRLIKHALGEVEMTQSQVQAATTLLRKIMPDLASQEITDKREGWLDVMKRLAGEKTELREDSEEQRTTH